MRKIHRIEITRYHVGSELPHYFVTFYGQTTAEAHQFTMLKIEEIESMAKKLRSTVVAGGDIEGWTCDPAKAIAFAAELESRIR